MLCITQVRQTGTARLTCHEWPRHASRPMTIVVVDEAAHEKGKTRCA